MIKNIFSDINVEIKTSLGEYEDTIMVIFNFNNKEIVQDDINLSDFPNLKNYIETKSISIEEFNSFKDYKKIIFYDITYLLTQLKNLQNILQLSIGAKNLLVKIKENFTPEEFEEILFYFETFIRSKLYE